MGTVAVGETLKRPPSGFSRWVWLSFQNRSIAASSGLTYRPHISRILPSASDVPHDMIHGIGQDTAPFSTCCGALDFARDFNGAPSGMSLGKGHCHKPPLLFPFSGFPTFDRFETRLHIGRLHSLFSIALPSGLRSDQQGTLS